MARKQRISTCKRKAHAKFLRAAGGNLTSCCEAPDHIGPHVYCMRVKQGIGSNSHALQYFEEVKRTVLKPVVFMDMRGRKLSSYGDCAALWQYLQEVERMRRSRSS